jgi:GNAT superfamily N-acetyltransferase
MPEVALRPMSAEEYRAYVAWAVPDYAEEIRRNTGIEPDDALRTARRGFDDILPEGRTTEGHRMLVAEDAASGEHVGILWIARQQRQGVRAAWVYDIFVEEPLRGQGYGRRLMELAEEQARELGVQRLELNVFGDNERARRLYGSLGYKEMSRQLYKEL